MSSNPRHPPSPTIATSTPLEREWTSSRAIDGWDAIVARLTEAGVEQVIHSEVSVYFTEPDGARIEPIADPLGGMSGEHVL